MKFAHFTAPDGRDVPINPIQVCDVLDNDQGLYDPRATAVIMLSGGFHAVRETRSEVIKRLEQA